MTGRIWTAMAGWALLGALVVLPAGCGKHSSTPAERDDGEEVRSAGISLPENQMVYPWSVVPGGVESPRAMREAMRADPVVGAHYAGLQAESFHPERLAERRQGYVSYRIRDKIYWTRRTVTLAAGEQVLTDGQTVVRGRCGNLFSVTPREPVAPLAVEPAEKAMDEPVRAAQLIASPRSEAEAPVETGKFENPKGFADGATAGSELPSPQGEEALPPVWVAGGGIGGPGGGVMGMGGFGGGSAGGSGGTVPGATATEHAALPPVTPSAVVEIPPPLVLVALTNPPSTPVVVVHPGFTPPELPYSPVPSPLPPLTWVPPPNPPGPETPPPQGPPPAGPPTPPGVPPSSDPPPSGPPPTGPPPFDPPTSPPPEVAVPEPGAWVLAVLGIGAIVVGSWRRRS